jgi:hypothetical protein
MHDSMPVSGERWLHRSDLNASAFGREDPQSLSDDCWEYLEDWEEHAKQLIPTPERAQRATAELIAARIRAATGSHAAERELRRTVERQQATINRLLAFVPTRSGAVDTSRLAAIVENIRTAAETIFHVPQIEVTEELEPEDDTTAYHRITVEIPVTPEFDVALFFQRTTELDHFVANELSDEEIHAIRVLIEPRVDG